MGLFTIKIWTCKNREKKIKNHIFIYVMHGMDVEKYANMYNNQPRLLEWFRAASPQRMGSI